MRYRILFLSVFGTVFGILLASWLALSQDKRHSLRASLEGFQEVPAVSTQARGDFQAHIDSTDTRLTYVLRYSGFTVTVTQAHIHFGAKHTIGGVSIFLCGTAAAPGPPGTPECPQAAGTVMRTVTAADVIGPGGQGIASRGVWGNPESDKGGSGIRQRSFDDVPSRRDPWTVTRRSPTRR